MDAEARHHLRALKGDANPVIPDKLYFRIGEVAKVLGVAAYVLRFWESEFPQLHPGKGGTGQRLYRRRDLELALRIKRLLYNEGYTILGARRLLKSELREKQPELPLLPAEIPTPKQKLRRVHSDLEEIASLLSRPTPGVRGPGGKAAERKGLHLAGEHGELHVTVNESAAGSMGKGGNESKGTRARKARVVLLPGPDAADTPER